eukprot:7250451-Pyramimonas_sp.AAC.1
MSQQWLNRVDIGVAAAGDWRCAACGGRNAASRQSCYKRLGGERRGEVGRRRPSREVDGFFRSPRGF